MKAKEYFDKYGADIYAECTIIADPNKIGPVMQKFLMEFSLETRKLYMDRRAKSVGALRSIVLEQNEKWNAICRMFQAQYGGVSPLKENGWRDLIKMKTPELFEH